MPLKPIAPEIHGDKLPIEVIPSRPLTQEEVIVCYKNNIKPIILPYVPPAESFPNYPHTPVGLIPTKRSIDSATHSKIKYLHHNRENP
jgi:hypothetical protein